MKRSITAGKIAAAPLNLGLEVIPLARQCNTRSSIISGTLRDALQLFPPSIACLTTTFNDNQATSQHLEGAAGGVGVKMLLLITCVRLRKTTLRHRNFNHDTLLGSDDEPTRLNNSRAQHADDCCCREMQNPTSSDVILWKNSC